MTRFTNLQARRFLLLKHGLSGDYKFTGTCGVYEYVRQTGCIQYDPIDVCGKNSELVFFSRVKNFTKDMLENQLYSERTLVDYPDKNLSIIPVGDWPYFERYREAARKNAEKYPEMQSLTETVRKHIEERGAVCSDDIKLDGGFRWHSAIHWSGGGNLSRSVLEQMYSTGDLVIHHKKGSRKYYDLSEKHISSEILRAPEPFPNDFDHMKWRVLRRISAVGLLWNHLSDAWLNIWDLNTETRLKIFEELIAENKIIPVEVEGLRDPLYCRSEDEALIEIVLRKTGAENSANKKPRCEFIAPLDCFMWDRKIIKKLFGFDYRWEIYYPAAQRKYGYYVLPVLYGDDLIGRIEAVADKKTKTLVVKNIWYEDGAKRTKKMSNAVEQSIKRFAVFNGCSKIKNDRLSID